MFGGIQRMAVMIDYTITIGNIIEITSILGGGALVLLQLKNTVGNLKTDVTDMKAELKKVGEVLIKLAVTDTRLSNVEQDIRELKHGEGFVLPFNMPQK